MKKESLIIPKILTEVLILFFLLNTSICYSQVNREWVARYNGPANRDDAPYSISVDNLGNVYVSGWSRRNGSGTDICTVKYNSSGVQQWAQRYNGTGTGYDEPRSIAIDGSGNVYVTGKSYGNGTGYDYCTIKYNSSGIQQWVQRYCNPLDSIADIADCIAVDGTGNIYISGTSELIYTTIKYSSSGIQQWVKKYPEETGYGYSQANSLAIDSENNIYVTGWSEKSPAYNSEVATIKYNSSGIQQWVQRFGGNCDNARANSIVVDGTGNEYVTGYSYCSGTQEDFATIKYNNNGVQQWVQIYNGPLNNDDEAKLIAVDNSSNVFVTGWSRNESDYDYATIKYNSVGVQQWVQRYTGLGSHSNRVRSIAADDSSNVYVTGSSYGNGTDWDYATIKYNSSGNQQWIDRYNGPGNSTDAASSMAIDKSGNVYVTGWSVGNGQNWDFATIKYSHQIGIKPISSEIQTQFNLSQNYPNPFNPSTKIKFDIPLSRGVPEGRGVSTSLIIYDILGREIATLVNEKLNPGTYEVEWDASSYPSGVYYYKLESESFSETKKMVLVK